MLGDPTKIIASPQGFLKKPPEAAAKGGQDENNSTSSGNSQGNQNNSATLNGTLNVVYVTAPPSKKLNH